MYNERHLPSSQAALIIIHYNKKSEMLFVYYIRHHSFSPAFEGSLHHTWLPPYFKVFLKFTCNLSQPTSGSCCTRCLAWGGAVCNLLWQILVASGIAWGGKPLKFHSLGPWVGNDSCIIPFHLHFQWDLTSTICTKMTQWKENAIDKITSLIPNGHI